MRDRAGRASDELPPPMSDSWNTDDVRSRAISAPPPLSCTRSSPASLETIEIQMVAAELQDEKAEAGRGGAALPRPANRRFIKRQSVDHATNDWDMIDDNPQIDGYEGRTSASRSCRWSEDTVPTLLSGFTNGSILFVFCCVFSSMIFGQNVVLQQEVAIGVGFFTISTFVGGILFGRYSKYPGMIAGPDSECPRAFDCIMTAS